MIPPAVTVVRSAVISYAVISNARCVALVHHVCVLRVLGVMAAM